MFYKFKYTKELKIFWITFIIGFIAHIYIITNRLYTADATVNGPWANFNHEFYISMGRWMMVVYTYIFRPPYVMPVVIGVLTIAFLSLITIIISKIFSIKNDIVTILIGCCIILFPQTTIMFSVMYASDIFAFAYLLIVVSFYLFLNSKNYFYFFLSILLFSLSLAIYQAYIVIPIILFSFYILFELFNNGITFTKLWKNIRRFFLYCFFGGGLYYVLNIIVLNILNIKMSSYRGLDKILQLDKSPFLILKDTWMYIFKFYFTDLIIVQQNRLKVAYAIVLFLVLFFLFSLNKDLFSKKKKILILIYTIIVIPIALSFIVIFARDTFINIAIVPGMPYIIILMLILLYRYTLKCKKNKYFTKLAFFVVIYILFYWNIFNNICYLQQQMQFDKTYSFANNLLSKIESVEEFDKKNHKVLFFGSIPNDNYSNTLDSNLKYIAGMNGIEMEYSLYDGGTLFSFLYNFMGANLNRVYNQEEYNIIINSLEFKNMPLYPKKGSIKIFNDILVVKLSD